MDYRSSHFKLLAKQCQPGDSASQLLQDTISVPISSVEPLAATILATRQIRYSWVFVIHTHRSAPLQDMQCKVFAIQARPVPMTRLAISDGVLDQERTGFRVLSKMLSRCTTSLQNVCRSRTVQTATTGNTSKATSHISQRLPH